MDMQDPNFRRLFYIRYADDFVILIAGPKNDALLIRSQIKDFLKKSCDLELNLDKSVISHITKEGFSFLGAQCIKANMIRNHIVEVKGISKSRRAHTRLRVQAPILQLLDKLLANGFIKRNHLNRLLATSRRDLVNLSHQDILKFYNIRTKGVLNYYSFAGNYSSLHRIIGFLKMSCALTLALKYKLRTARSAFSKFGPKLMDPDSLQELYVPHNLKVRHDYKIGSVPQVDQLLKAS
jgi:hypothetical protein